MSYLRVPLRVETTLTPQFQIAGDAGERMTMSVGRGRAQIGSAFPIEIQRLMSMFVNATSVRTTTLRAQSVQTTSEILEFAPDNDIVTLTTSIFGNIISLVGQQTWQFDVILPSAVDVIRAAGIETRVGDTLAFDIINNVAAPGRFVISAPTDTVAPANLGPDCAIALSSYARMLCYVAEITPVARVQYYLLGGISGSLAPLTRVPDEGTLNGTNPYAIYCVDRTNALYRYGHAIIPAQNWIVSAEWYQGVDFLSLEEALANPRVTSGHKILIANGTYTVAAPIVIDKSVTIFGESRAGVTFRNVDGGETGSIFRIVVSNVAISGMTFADYTPARDGADTIIDVAKQPGSSLSRAFVTDCDFAFTNNAITIDVDGVWRVNGCNFMYRGLVPGAHCVAVKIISTAGDGFVQSCPFVNTAPGNCALTLVTLAGCSGASTLSVVGCGAVIPGTPTDPLECLLRVGEFQGAPGSLELYVMMNNVSETGSFVELIGSGANFGDVFGQCIALENYFTNVHGRGCFAVNRSGAGTVDFRASGPLVIHEISNFTPTGDVAPGWAAAVNAFDMMCCYNTVTVNVVTVAQDRVVPSQPFPPNPPSTNSEDFTGMIRIGVPYAVKETRLLGAGDLVSITTTTGYAQPGTINVMRGREVLIETVDYAISFENGTTCITWIGSLAQGESEEMHVGDRVSLTYQQFH